jgi:hypothetical protein
MDNLRVLRDPSPEWFAQRARREAERLARRERKLIERFERMLGNQAQVTAKVAAQARPESTDFAKLVTWMSNGAIQPGADDFTNLWLLFRTFLPQVGGLVLVLAKGRSA